MIIGLDASRANVTQRTGTERYAWEVISRLVQSLSEHTIRLYIREPLLPDWPTLGSHVEVRILRWRPGILWSHLRLSWEMLRHAPDVLFVPADTVPLIHPRQTITTIHDVAFERFPELYRNKTVQRRLKWLRPIITAGIRVVTLGKYGPSERDYHQWSVRHALRTCTTIITVSEFTKREIIDIYDVSGRNITVIPIALGRDLRPAQLSAETVQAMQHRFELHRKYAIFIGRLESKKNILLLLQAYQRYRQIHSQPVDLVLIGTEGYGWDQAAAYIRENNLNGVVHVLGWQNDDVSVSLHAGAQAFIFISQYEGFGMPALESLSIGVPVLASRHGSLPEVLSPAAYFVDTTIEEVAKGLVAVTTDQAMTKKLIALGRKQCTKYSWDRTTAQTQELLLAQPLPRQQ